MKAYNQSNILTIECNHLTEVAVPAILNTFVIVIYLSHDTHILVVV